MISPMLNQISSNNNGLEKMEDKVLPTKSVDGMILDFRYVLLVYILIYRREVNNFIDISQIIDSVYGNL